MELTLSEGERVIKSWDYGKDKGKFTTKGLYNLTLTNKKIVSTHEGNKTASRDDYDLNDISGVGASFTYECAHKVLAIILCCTVFLALIGILILVFCKKAQLSVTLYNHSSAERIIGLNGLSGKVKRKNLKIKVDTNCAKDIVNNLAVLVDNAKAAVNA